VLVGDYSAKALALINEKGDIEWQTPIRNIHDVTRLPNGNLLMQTDWTEIIEMTPDHQIVWKYDAALTKTDSDSGASSPWIAPIPQRPCLSHSVPCQHAS
jgi:hypothetical protein